MKSLKIQDKRTGLAIKNIGLSILLRGGSILISFILVPMTLGYLNEYEYGIWLTMNSVLSWVYLLDIGLGNGLRNKLTESLATNNYKLGKIYVSTTFFYMALIVIGFYLLFLISQLFINWYDILNVSPERVRNLNQLVTIIFAFICTGFLFKMIGNVYMAYQLPSVNDLLSFMGSIISMCIIFFLTKTTNGSLKNVALTYSAVPAIIYILAFPITFKIFPKISPSFKFVRKRYFKDLISLGVRFLIIQIAVLVIFMTSNILIANIFGPEEVTPYNIAFRYISILTIGFNIILTPIWSAITEAFTKNDYKWIKNTFKRLILIWGIFSLCSVFMVLFSPYAYELWLGDKVIIPLSLTVLSAIYVSITNLCNIFAYIINGIGKLYLQLVFSVIQGVIYIPLAIFCSHVFGVKGILIALCITCSISFIWSPIQCFKLLNKTAKGIWNR